jgi:hypothetical protein
MDEILNRAISLNDLAKLAPKQAVMWEHFFDEVNKIEDAINEAENALADLNALRWAARSKQAAAWTRLVKAANAAFDANKSKI